MDIAEPQLPLPTMQTFLTCSVHCVCCGMDSIIFLLLVMKRVGVTVAQIKILDDDKIDVFVLYLTSLILV